MNSRRNAAVSGALVAAFVVGLQAMAGAIPAFARKYHTTCARCHSVVPRLNNYGWNFKLRGFHVPGDEDMSRVQMPEDKFLHLLDSVPLAIRVLGQMSDVSGAHAKPNVSADNKLEFLMGGNLARNMGFYLEYEAEKNDAGDGFNSGIGNARFMWTDLIKNNPTALNLEVGKFNLDEFGISNGRRLTVNGYAIYQLADAVGNFGFEDEVQGVNIYGAFGTGIGHGESATEQKAGKTGQVSAEDQKALDEALKEKPAEAPPESPEMVAARAVLEALVAKGTLTQDEADKTLADLASKLPQAPAPTPPAEPEKQPSLVPLAKTDYDVRKGVFYQAGVVTRTLPGGNVLQGYGRLTFASPQNWWIGPVAYWGGNELTTTGATPITYTDHFNRIGVEAGWSGGPRRSVSGVPRPALEILAAYQNGLDNNIDGTGARVRHSGGFGEASYILDDKNLGIVRWDRLDSSDAPSINVDTITFNFTRYLQRNLKVGLEYVMDLQHGSSTHTSTNTFYLFYDFAF